MNMLGLHTRGYITHFKWIHYEYIVSTKLAVVLKKGTALLDP
jgi:hypothetical protein